jgi:L-seryl-tRNA(Ser) seleniumtransferase
MLTLSFDYIETKAKALEKMLKDTGDTRMKIERINVSSKAGGGALPLLNLPSQGLRLTVEGMTPNAIEKYLRNNELPIIGRIEEDMFIMDLRTIQDDEFSIIKKALEDMLKGIQS